MSSTVNYLDAFLDPVAEVFTPQVAQKLVDLRPDPQLQARMEELRRKANNGTITVEEDREYKDFVEAVDFIAILQAKARRFLANHSG